MRQSPTSRAVVDIRKREVASAKWAIVPNLDDHQEEIDWLEKLVHGALVPYMAYKLDLF